MQVFLLLLLLLKLSPTHLGLPLSLPRCVVSHLHQDPEGPAPVRVTEVRTVLGVLRD